MYDSSKLEDKSAPEPLPKSRGHSCLLVATTPPPPLHSSVRQPGYFSQAAPPLEHLPESGLSRLLLVKAQPLISFVKSFSISNDPTYFDFRCVCHCVV